LEEEEDRSNTAEVMEKDELQEAAVGAFWWEGCPRKNR
jgi:hypothetical protein